MRVRTELSELPPSFSVTNDSGTARIRFFEDVQEVQREEGPAYTATMWEMSVPWQDNLHQRIRKATELWRAKVKAVTAAEESAARLEELKATATDDAICDLGEMVAYLSDAVIELAMLINP